MADTRPAYWASWADTLPMLQARHPHALADIGHHRPVSQRMLVRLGAAVTKLDNAGSFQHPGIDPKSGSGLALGLDAVS